MTWKKRKRCEKILFFCGFSDWLYKGSSMPKGAEGSPGGLPKAPQRAACPVSPHSEMSGIPDPFTTPTQNFFALPDI